LNLTPTADEERLRHDFRAWLRDHLPPPAPRQTVVHGDMRTGNIIVGPPR